MSSSYDILGIPHTAKKEDIKKAYRKLSLIHHPDVPGGNTQRFMQIKSAYEELMVPDTTRVHQQYQHRHPPYTAIVSQTITSKGNCEIYLVFRNISYIETIDIPNHKYNWTVFGMNGGYLEVTKKDLISCGYKFIVRITPVIGHSIIKEFIFNDPRPWWQKWWTKFRIKYDIYWP